MFRGCTFDNQNVNSKNDGGLYQAIFQGDGILWGCSMSVTNDTLTVQQGEMMIAGRLVWVDGATQISFSDPIANGYGQVILTIDLSKTATTSEFKQIEPTVVYSTTTTFPELTQGDINSENGDMVYQQELAVVSIAGSNITGITRQIGGAEIDAAKLGGKPPEYYLNTEQRSSAIDSASEITVATSAAVNALRSGSLAYKGVISWDAFNYATGLWVMEGGTAPVGTANRGTALVFGGGEEPATSAQWRYLAIYIDINGIVAVMTRAGNSSWSQWKVLNGYRTASATPSSTYFESSSYINFIRTGRVVVCSGYLHTKVAWNNNVKQTIATIPSGYRAAHYMDDTLQLGFDTYSFALIQTNPTVGGAFTFTAKGNIPANTEGWFTTTWVTNDNLG